MRFLFAAIGLFALLCTASISGATPNRLPPLVDADRAKLRSPSADDQRVLEATVLGGGLAAVSMDSGPYIYLHEAGHGLANKALYTQATSELHVDAWDALAKLAENPKATSTWLEALAPGGGHALMSRAGEKTELYHALQEHLGPGGPRAFISAGGTLATLTLDIGMVAGALLAGKKLGRLRDELAQLEAQLEGGERGAELEAKIATTRRRVVRYERGTATLWGFAATSYADPIAYAASGYFPDPVAGHDFLSIARNLDIDPAVTIAALVIPPWVAGITLLQARGARRRDAFARIAITRLAMRGALPQKDLDAVAPDLREELVRLEGELARLTAGEDLDPARLEQTGRRLQRTRRRYVKALAKAFAPQVASEVRLLGRALHAAERLKHEQLEAMPAPKQNAKQKAIRAAATVALATAIGAALALVGPVYGAFGATSTLLGSKDVNSQLLADARRKLGLERKSSETAKKAGKNRVAANDHRRATELSRGQHIATTAMKLGKGTLRFFKENPVTWNVPIGLSIFGLGLLEKDPSLISAGATYSLLGIKTTIYAAGYRGAQALLRSTALQRWPEHLDYPVTRWRRVKERLGLRPKQRTPRH